MAIKRAPLYVLEGAWDKPHEAPQVLPYFLAYAQTYRNVELNHRTFKSVEDIEYYVSRLPKNGRAFVYVACHGQKGFLIPGDQRSKVPMDAVNSALQSAKENSIGFVHFGCCAFIKTSSTERRKTLEVIRGSARAAWVSGYTRDVDWLSSLLLDLALISEIYTPWWQSPTSKVAHQCLELFTKSYEQLSRSLGLSVLSTISGESTLFPKKILRES